MDELNRAVLIPTPQEKSKEDIEDKIFYMSRKNGISVFHLNANLV
jgi:hypothetical protein